MTHGHAHLQEPFDSRGSEAASSDLTPGQFARPVGPGAPAVGVGVDLALRGVAHDLRCPLTSILLASQVLLLEVGMGDGHRRRRLESIVRSARRALALTEDLARGSACAPLALARHDLRELAREVLELHAAEAEAARVTLRADLPAGPAPVTCDRAQLGRALSNLVGNAVKFSPRDAVVDVRVERRAGAARVLVTDRGPGVAAADRPRLFEPGFVADPARGGLGLGLGIARAIAQAHGGRVDLRSEPGRGSTFWLEVPDHPAEVVRGG